MFDFVTQKRRGREREKETTGIINIAFQHKVMKSCVRERERERERERLQDKEAISG